MTQGGRVGQSTVLLPLFLLLCYFPLIFSTQASPLPGGFISVDPTTSRLRDQDGRERIFHGTNVVYKAPPYIPQTNGFNFQYSFSEVDMKNIAVCPYSEKELI
jgi:hypothetical protein